MNLTSHTLANELLKHRDIEVVVNGNNILGVVHRANTHVDEPVVSLIIDDYEEKYEKS